MAMEDKNVEDIVYGILSGMLRPSQIVLKSMILKRIFRALPKICDRDFVSKMVQRRYFSSIFTKKVHLRCSTGSLIRPWYLLVIKGVREKLKLSYVD